MNLDVLSATSVTATRLAQRRLPIEVSESSQQRCSIHYGRTFATLAKLCTPNLLKNIGANTA
ncbi:MAG: hypothetical protein ACJA13_001775 [Paraglaciecola sp.]|jgi:hypothetical protein